MIRSLIACFGCLAALCLPPLAHSQINVLTSRYDNARSGANLQETALSTANVNVNQFGRLYSDPVDGAIYAQPLYVSGVTIAGVRHNVVYVATMNDKVYAFDADQAAAPLWTRDFTNSKAGVTAVPITDLVGADNLNIVGNVGIESTPVIDVSAGTLYLLARTKESGSYVQRLHALDLSTGAERSGSPAVISAAINSSAPDAVNGTLYFDPKMENQRPGLALSNGVVLISWASHEDDAPFHGWILGYDAATLQQVGVFCTTPQGTDGGIWQSGRAPVIDSQGNAYFQTGNGDWDGQQEFGDSVLKLTVSTKGFALADWFTPADQSTLNAGDIDLGSTGAMLIPGTNVLLAGGKESVLYLLQTTNLGHFANGNTQILQSLPVNGGEMKGGPAFWNSPAAQLVYMWTQTDVLRAYRFNGTTLDTRAYATGAVYSAGSPGGTLTISANGSTAGSGIVWAELSTSQDGDHGTVPGIVRAFNAETLQELWNSEMNATRDRLGTLVKYVPPVVANGKVYAVTYDNLLAVYGLLPGVSAVPDFTVGVGSGTATVPVAGTVSVPVTVASLNAFAGTVAFSVAGLPSGATATFTPSSVSGSGNSTLQIVTSTATPAGSYPLTITGSSGTALHTADLQLTVSSSSAQPTTAIGIDFAGNGTPMLPTELAGVVPKTHWNSATGASGSISRALIDENGTATGASVTWSSDNTWSTTIADTPGNFRMMKGYLDTKNGNASSVTVTSLAPSANGYDVYVYVDGDNPEATRTGAYQISGPGITTSSILATDPANTNFAGTFLSANGTTGNYLKFSIQSTGFTLTATPGATSDAYPRAPINGIQIVPSPAPDFTLTATTGASAVAAGGTANVPLTVGSLNAFAGTVTFSVAGLPGGTTASFNPSSVSGSGSSTLQIVTSTPTPAGVYPLTITGTSGTTLHTAAFQLTVSSSSAQPATAIGIDFAGTGTPIAPTEIAGVVPKAYWNSATGASGFLSRVLTDENGSATSASVTWSSDNAWSTNIADTPGNFRMMKGYLDTKNGNASSVTVAGLAPSATGYDVYVYVDGDNSGATRTGAYQISGPGIATSSILATDPANTNFAGTFLQANGSTGNYLKFSIQSTGFTLTATPGATSDAYPRAPINGIQIVPSPAPDFTLTATTSASTVAAGGTANVPLTVASLNGFTGTVSFSVAGLPGGTTASFNPASVSGSGNSTLQIVTSSATPAGVYSLTISGAGGTTVHTAAVQLTVSSSSVQPATVISIDFAGTGTPMLPTEVAGLAAKAHWNSVTGASGSLSRALTDENGAATGASVTWSSDNAWSTNIADTPGSFRMMKGYLDTKNGNPSSVTVTGLPASASGYTVYVYVDGDNPGASRTALYQISGPGITTSSIAATDPASTNFAGVFLPANGTTGNYLKFSIQSTGFTLTATPGATSDAYPRAPINGIQIVPLPAGS